jgi:hypothetical protein
MIGHEKRQKANQFQIRDINEINEINEIMKIMKLQTMCE